MGLFEKAKRAFKTSKGNAPSVSTLPEAGAAASLENHPQPPSPEIKPTHSDKALGISLLSPGVSPIVE